MYGELGIDPGNVVRFPTDRQITPSMDFLREIAPDHWKVARVAGHFGLPLPDTDVRSDADRQVADYIVNHVRPEPGAARRNALHALMAPLMRQAVDACRLACDAEQRIAEARDKLNARRMSRCTGLAALMEEIHQISERSAALLIEAYLRTEVAEGASRAVGMALRGECWVPLDCQTNGNDIMVAL